MRRSTTLLVLGVLAVVRFAIAGSAPPLADQRKLRPVQFTEVKITDPLLAPRIETNRKVSIPHNLDWCEKTGRISNFSKAAGLMEGKFQGIYFDDSDLYKVIEGASYSLAAHPDPALDKRLDEIIAKIAAAQQPDGYINTYYTLAEPGKRWTNLRVRHELYCGGHLIEAAVAHFRATGKKTLLDVATRFADHVSTVFGPDKRHDVCGHEEIELALIKLYHLTQNPKYYKLAEFFLNMRGNAAERQELYGDYCQDHMPVREQREIGGHAVRAMYLYSAVADAAAITRDAGFIAAMEGVWGDVTKRKMYITGGIGPSAHNEGFTVPFDLPNESAYAETCASIGMALWNHRLNLLHADGKYFDEVERVLYNGLLSGVALSGEKFFYVNPLASKGRHHRQPWFSCACCPSNMVRFLPSLPGYVYATSDDGIYVNLYARSEGNVKLGQQAYRVRQETKYPWEGAATIELSTDGAEVPQGQFVYLRIPGWAKEFSISANGQRLASPEVKSGYVQIPLKLVAGAGGKKAMRIWLDLAMPVERVQCSPAARANLGRVAVQRGPIVYCLEGTDNKDVDLFSVVLPDNAQFSTQHDGELLGGVTVIRTQGVIPDPQAWDSTLYTSAPPAGKKTSLTFVPYHAWDNREPGQMMVWLPTDVTASTRIVVPTLAGSSKVSASHCNAGDTVEALRDQFEPANSNDHSIPRFTWWDHRGTSEWVQYDFAKPASVSVVEVYWFEDTAGCRAPQSWTLQYKEGDGWKDVEKRGAYETRINRFNKLTFKPVTTTALRITVQLKEQFSGGILEWKAY